MNFTSLYRISFYVMLIFATLVLSVDATDSRLAMLFPPLVTIAAVIAFLTVDRNPKLALPSAVGDLLALGTIALFFIEWNIENLLLIALGHWLVYLQISLFFRAKTVEQDWYLFGLGLVQVLIGTVVSQSDTVGIILFTWAILALWVLGLFSLRRDAARAAGGGELPKIPGGGGSELYPGLLNIAFLISGVRVTAITLALGGAIFLAMPRTSGGVRSPGGEARLQHLTGFDDEVQLGQLGEILESDDVVMNIELFDEQDHRVPAPGEALWRGVTMDVYRNSRWFRQRRREGTQRLPFRTAKGTRPPGKNKIIRQQIKLEPNDSNVLFALRPMIDVTTSRRFVSTELNPLDGSISLPAIRSGSFDYEVRSYLDSTLPQPGEDVPDEALLTSLLTVPEDLSPHLAEIASQVIEENLAEDKRENPVEIARVLDEYLRTSGKFGYTLRLERTDPSLDPVEDFLVNHKSGHCEYFASALTLMLRSVGIPARMVNGFKGGDWNDIAQVLNVRQKHAHSWVEAYLPVSDDPTAAAHWVTLDPTPGTERDQAVARVGGFRGNFRQLSDLLRYIWVFYIVGYNAERQNRLLYGPIRQLALEARRGFRMIAAAIESARIRLMGLLHFPTVKAFFSPRGFVVSFIALLLLAAIVRAAVWVGRKLARWLWGSGVESGPLSAGASQYRRLAQLLAEFGLERPAAETPDEFARRAALFLNGHASYSGTLAEVPKTVVDAYYRVRFGRLELPAATEVMLDHRLDALESAMRASSS